MELTDAVRQYLNAITAQGHSRYTVRAAKSALKEIVAFLKALAVTRIEQLDHDALMQYREELAWRLTPKATPLAPRSQAELLGHLRAFCRWLVAQDWLVSDPSKKIPNPKKPQQLPKAILEPREIDKILAQPDVTTALGYRDRVILELLYATAMRREETAHLLLEDIDTESGYVVIRQGKGRKDRVVPIGQQVCLLLDTYVAGVRTDLVGSANDAHLFVNRFGQKMDPNTVWRVVHKYAAAANLKKPVSTHTFRHSCATHMLRNGAPIRHIQELLGHASLETTQVYTRITINDLKAIHQRYHPREQQKIAE